MSAGFMSRDSKLKTITLSAMDNIHYIDEFMQHKINSCVSPESIH
jgi:hypothetical protein